MQGAQWGKTGESPALSRNGKSGSDRLSPRTRPRFSSWPSFASKGTSVEKITVHSTATESRYPAGFLFVSPSAVRCANRTECATSDTDQSVAGASRGELMPMHDAGSGLPTFSPTRNESGYAGGSRQWERRLTRSICSTDASRGEPVT